ncbi:MAG: glycosyl transferase family 1, partial [Thermoplasmata archaeon]
VNTAKYLPDVRFVVIGKFIDNSIEYVKKNASTNVGFTGFVSENELIEWYQRAKVICQLSYYEAFGLAPAEGMACECIPVVTKERAGLPEFVGDCGFYVSYGDEKATAEAIKKALNAPDELGKKARERIKEMFPLEKREMELRKLINKVYK